jgi:hypothetical protein
MSYGGGGVMDPKSLGKKYCLSTSMYVDKWTLTLDRIQASAMRRKRITAWSKVRPLKTEFSSLQRAAESKHSPSGLKKTGNVHVNVCTIIVAVEKLQILHIVSAYL